MSAQLGNFLSPLLSADFIGLVNGSASAAFGFNSMEAATFALVTYAGSMAVALPKLVFGIYGGGPWLLAAITTSAGAGTIAEAIFVGQVLLRHRGMIAFLAYVLNGLALLVFSWPFSLNLAIFITLPAAFVVGLGMDVMRVIWSNLLYELIPDDKPSRVASVGLLGSLGLLSIGDTLAGWFSDHRS